MDAALTRRVEQQRIEMLYDNTLAVSGSALLMAALIAVIAWPHTRVANIVAWAGAALLVQASVLALSVRIAARAIVTLHRAAGAGGLRPLPVSPVSCGAPQYSCSSDPTNRSPSR
jgi:hypothetical protein